MITAKTKKVAENAEKEKAPKPSNSSTSESDQSTALQNLDPETRNMLQTVIKIKKDLLKNLKNYDPSGTNEALVDVLRRYVGQCGETAQTFIEKSDYSIAEKILRSCENLLKTKMPQDLVAQTGMFYQVNNNLANLANRTGDVQASIKYLLAALDCANDPRIQSKDDLTISETLLNLANANIYLSKFEFGLRYADQAYQFAAKNGDGLQQMIRGCEQKRAHLGESHPEIVKMQDYFNSLQDQYLGQVNLKVLAKYATGQAFEKMEKFDNAIHEFRIGTQLVENNFGTQHHMYAVLANAMGGARLKTKFQTKEVIPRKKPSPKRKSPPKEEPKPKRKESAKAPPKLKPLRPNSANGKIAPRRNIKKIIESDIVDYHKKTHVAEVRRSSRKNLKDNLFMTNCDTWADVHCHRPKPHRSRSSSKGMRHAVSMKTFDHSMTSLDSRRSNRKSPKVRIKKVKKPAIVKVKPQTRGESPDISNESVNIKITPRKKQEKASPDLTTKSTHDSKKTIIIRESAPSSHSQLSSQSPFNGAFMQQLQMMRQMQEDQFKMMQLVIQSKRQNEAQPQHQMPIYGPGMIPFQGYYPYPYDPRYMYGSYATETDYSETDRTETDHRSDYERSETEKSDKKYNSTKQPKKDEKPKKAKKSSQESPTDLNDRESQQMTFPPRRTSQASRASQDDLHRSLNSEQFHRDHFMCQSGKIHESAIKRVTTFKEEAVREKETSNSLAASPPFKSSLKAKSTQDLHVLDDSQKRKSEKSPKSNLSGSTVYEKSFRAAEPQLSKAEAAIIIQKNFKGHLVRDEYRNIAYGKKKGGQPLCKTNYRCKSGSRPIVTCKVNSDGTFAKSLEFHVDKPHNKFEISLTKLGRFEVYGLKEKVLKILEQCQKFGDVKKDIQNAFQSALATKILTEDEQDPVQENPFKENETVGNLDPPYNDKNSESESEEQIALRPESKSLSRREQMQAEFIKIKEQMMGTAIQLNKVEVLDHRPRFLRSEESSPSSIDSDAVSLIKGGQDDHLKPVVIEKIQVNRRFKKHGKNKGTRSRSSSEHSYKVFLQEQSERVLWEGAVNNQNVVFQVKLVKLDFLDYVLTAKYGSDITKTEISHLPFEEEQAKTNFEDSLILVHKDCIITELNLKQTAQTSQQPPDSSLLQVEYSRTSKHSSFAQHKNYSKKVLYMFNTLRIDQTEYHVEVTQQYTDSYHLNVYVISVKELADKDKISVELFEKDSSDFVSAYVEDNLMINRKIGDKNKKISHLSISYPKSALNGRKIDDSYWQKSQNEFTIKRDGQTYRILINKVPEKGIFIKCENQQGQDYCLFQLSKLDFQGNFEDFIKNNLQIFTDEKGNLSKLKLAGFIDGEGNEQVSHVPVDSGYWRPLHEVGFVFAETQLRSQLLISVPSKAEVDDVKKPIPAIQDDSPWYKIQIFHVNQGKVIGDIVLTPSQCEILLTSELKLGKSIGEQNLPCAQLKKGSMQLQAAIKKSNFEKNQQQWERVLLSAIYMQSLREVRFKAPSTRSIIEDRSMTPMNESSFLEIDRKIEQLMHQEVKYEDGHMISLLKTNEEYRQTLSSPVREVKSKRTKNTEQKEIVPDKAKKQQKELNSTDEDNFTQKKSKKPIQVTKTDFEEDDQIQAEEKKQIDISKRIEAAKQKAKADKKTEQANNQVLSGPEGEGSKLVGGIVKCDGSQQWLSFTLAVDQKTSQIVLTVKERSKDGKFLAKNQVLSKKYIKEITLDDPLAEGHEILNLLKGDLESKLRENGARLLKQGSISLPEAFFFQQAAEENIRDDQGSKPTQKPDGKLLHQKSVEALRNKKAHDEEEDYHKDDTLSAREQNINSVRGAVKAKDSDQYFNIALFLDPSSNEITLTVKQVGSQGQHIAQKQKLTSDYIQSVSGQVRIKQGDNQKVLQKLKADIESRLKEFGGDLKPGNSLPEKFFALKDEDEQEVSFQEPGTPRETKIQLSPSNQEELSSKKAINFEDKMKRDSSQKKIAAVFRGKQERKQLKQADKQKLKGACKMDNEKYVRFSIVKDGEEYKLTVQTVDSKQTFVKDVSLPSNLANKADFLEDEEFEAALKDIVGDLLKNKGSAICDAVKNTGAIPKSLC